MRNTSTSISRQILSIVTVCLLMVLGVSAAYAAPETPSSVCHIGANYYDSVSDAVAAASDNDTIYITKSINVAAQITVNISKTISIVGETDGLFLKRAGDFSLFEIQDGSSVSFSNITLDGGAVWNNASLTASASQTRTNTSGIVASKSLITGLAGSTISLHSGTIVQNCELVPASSNAIGASITLLGSATTSSTLNIYDNAAVRLGTSKYTIGGGNHSGGIMASENTVVNMYGGVIEACASIDSGANSGAAIFVRSDGIRSTFNMLGDSVIRENYNNSCGAVTVRFSNFAMEDDSSVYNNSGVIGAGVLAYTTTNMAMSNNAAIYNNQATQQGGGIYLSANTNDASTWSSLVMNDDSTVHNNNAADWGGGLITSRGTIVMNDASSIANNTSATQGGGVFLSLGTMSMFDNSTVTGNSAPTGGGIFLRVRSDTNKDTLNLISGSISGNSSTGTGAAIYHGGTALNLNAADFSVSGSIFLYGSGTNASAKVITLVAAPTTNNYTLDTEPINDAFNGRDVVRPGSITIDGTTYTLTDASPNFDHFTHTTKVVREGAYYYSPLSDTSHDTYLVLVTPPATCTVDFDSQGGSYMESQTVSYGAKASLPVNPAYTGYVFGGWFREASCTTSWVFSSDTVIDNITLFAKWTPIGATTTVAPASSVPQTGDNSHVYLWLSLFLASVSLLVLYSVHRFMKYRRRNHS